MNFPFAVPDVSNTATRRLQDDANFRVNSFPLPSSENCSFLLQSPNDLPLIFVFIALRLKMFFQILMPQLESISDGLKIENNNGIQEMHFGSLSTVGENVVFSGNTGADYDFQLPALLAVVNSMEFTNNFGNQY